MLSPRPTDIDDALSRVSEIHAHVARGSMFRGYRAIPVASMGVIALVVAGIESVLWPNIAPGGHAKVWIGVAIICSIIGAVDVFVMRAGGSRRTTRTAVAQLLPALVVGGVLGFVLTERAELLPGLWTMVFGLGVLASKPYLPEAILGVALFYVVAGMAMTLAVSEGVTPSPWEMGITFGVGQFVAALALRRIERT